MRKILHIEKDTTVQKQVSEILHLANYEIITASSGKTGIDLAIRHKPDLIISAVSLEELDGYEVLYFLRKKPATKSIPFIFLTVKTTVRDVRRGMNAGADDYLFKPVNKLDLVTSIETQLMKSENLRNEFSQDLDGLSDILSSVESKENFKKITTKGVERKVVKKEVIYREGDTAHYVYYIRSGTIKTFINNQGGKEFITGLNHAGDFAGIIDLLKGEICKETAQATEDSDIILIPKKEFFSFLISNHNMSARFIQMLSQNIYEIRERLFHIVYSSVRKRTANALITLPVTGENGHDKRTISISRDDLAALIGITPESVSRTLHDFKTEKLISFKNKSREITLLKKDQLAEMKN